MKRNILAAASTRRKINQIRPHNALDLDRISCSVRRLELTSRRDARESINLLVVNQSDSDATRIAVLPIFPLLLHCLHQPGFSSESSLASLSDLVHEVALIVLSTMLPNGGEALRHSLGFPTSEWVGFTMQLWPFARCRWKLPQAGDSVLAASAGGLPKFAGGHEAHAPNPTAFPSAGTHSATLLGTGGSALAPSVPRMALCSHRLFTPPVTVHFWLERLVPELHGTGVSSLQQRLWSFCLGPSLGPAARDRE